MESSIQFLVFIPLFAILIVVIAGMWKAFVKAGHPGWACLIPFYNYYIFTVIAGRPGWWVILMLVPYVSLVFMVIISIDIAKKFGKGSGFGIGLAFLSPIFWPILGFGDAQYIGDGGDSIDVDSFGETYDDINTESQEVK